MGWSAQIGLVLDNTAVSMVVSECEHVHAPHEHMGNLQQQHYMAHKTARLQVPGGPAYKPINGKQIEKNDIVLAIDPDGKVCICMCIYMYVCVCPGSSH